MIAGFLVWRPLNSICTILFGINALRSIHPKEWIKQKWWLLGVCWVGMYALTYFWSTDIYSWHERFDTKLPVLLLPLGFAFLPRFSIKQLQIFTVAVSLMMLAGAAYSAYFFVQSSSYYINEYGQSQVLPTPVENDHICFSIGIAVVVAWCVSIFPYLVSKAVRWLAVVTIVLLSVFLHLLAAKSGLVAWYVFVLGWCIYVAIRKNKLVGIGMIVAGVLFVVAAFRYVPTFRNKIGYVEYTYGLYKSGSRTGDYSDMGRVISYDIAVKLIKEHPWGGVGAGDILEAMKGGYDRWYPQVKEEQRLFPHNQFLTIALGCGLPAVLLFIAWLLYPLVYVPKTRAGIFFIITWCMLLVPLLVEPFLEIQFGVFVYLFFVLWQRQLAIKELEPEPAVQ
ncbi:MAG: O-antigen ligase family protein [Taibaiella sp.]|nr:O-antigen ligase family protein [Taibaiella sp.]